MKRGLDISRHQGNINFDAIKDEYDFVIIRIGVGDDLSGDDSQCSQCDDKAAEYIQACIERDIPFALYIYSYATCIDEAYNEARHIREWYEKYNPVLGVWLDMEDADGYKYKHGVDYASTEEFCITWLAALSDINPRGIYASHSWISSYLDADEIKDMGGYLWEAHWNDDGEICDDRFDMSQESSDYYVDGVRVDFDIMRDEFFDMWVTPSNEEEEKKEEETTMEDSDLMLALKSVRGDFGNGQDRIDALGDRYESVQDIINNHLNALLELCDYI